MTFTGKSILIFTVLHLLHREKYIDLHCTTHINDSQCYIVACTVSLEHDTTYMIDVSSIHLEYYLPKSNMRVGLEFR